MSNALSVRRVMVQTINADGSPDGPPTYGVTAADDYAQNYIDVFGDLESLNAAIDEAGCILCVVPDWGDLWDRADTNKIGKDNFYGSDWELAPGEDAPEVKLS